MEFKDKEFIIVEDDPEFRAFVKGFLDSRSCKVKCYERADTAMKEIRDRSWNWSPFMIITDIIFPGISGYSFIRQVHELYARKPVAILAISKLTGSDDQAEAELAGATRYLRKPVKNEAVLEAAIKEAAQRAYDPNKNSITINSG